VGVAAIAFAVALALHALLARRPLAGLGGAAGVAVAACGLLAGWTLLSGDWSDAQARAVVESDRTVLYLLALAALAAPALGPDSLRRAVMGVAAAAVVVCGIGLVTRVAPDLWPIADGPGKGRLSYPLTYWNSFGLMAALGGLLCLHLASDERGPRLARVLGAAAVPGLVAALVLSYSRGAAAAGIAGLVAYLALGRPRLLPSALLSVVAASIVAGVAAYDAERLATSRYDTPAGIDQGHDVALVVGLAMLAAGALRALLLRSDVWFAIRPPLGRGARRRLAVAAAAAVVAGVGLSVAAGAPGALADGYEEFVEGKPLRSSGVNVRERFTDPSNNGRIDYWEISLDEFAERPLRGSGAGTFQHLWARERPIPVAVIDGHTLYGETLAELGAVGLALLAVALLALVAGVAARLRAGEERALHACVLAVLVAWVLAAAVDWHWELPAVTLPVLALAAVAAGGARAARAGEAAASARRRVPALRIGAAVAALALAATPVAAALSQRRLNDAVDAFKAGDCPAAIDSAQGALDVMRFRPEPFEVIGYCRSRQGRHAEAVRALERAIDRDPRSWELHYGLALVRAAGGLDPRPPAGRALALNPREVLAQRAVERFRAGNRARWRRESASLEIPIR
jgi:O-antigen ligase